MLVAVDATDVKAGALIGFGGIGVTGPQATKKMSAIIQKDCLGMKSIVDSPFL
jgi:hypothetical protein